MTRSCTATALGVLLACAVQCHAPPVPLQSRRDAPVAGSAPSPASAPVASAPPPSDSGADSAEAHGAFLSLPHDSTDLIYENTAPLRGPIGPVAVVLWLRPVRGSRGVELSGKLSGRYYRIDGGADVPLTGEYDDAGAFALRDPSGTDVFEGTWRQGEPMRGVHRGAGLDGPFELAPPVPAPDLTVTLVPRRLFVERDRGAPSHCLVEVDYFEILDGIDLTLENQTNLQISPRMARWSTDCHPGQTFVQRTPIHVNLGGVLSFEVQSFFDGQLDSKRVYCFNGDIPKLGDVIASAPRDPPLATLLAPYFRKALGGSADKAAKSMHELQLDTADPMQPTDCLVDKDAIRFVWVDRDHGIWRPTPDGIRIPFDDLERKHRLNLDDGFRTFFLLTRPSLQ